MRDFDKQLDTVTVLTYNEPKDTIYGGVMMTSKEALTAAMKEKGVTQAETAAMVNWTPMQLSSRLMRSSLRADDFITLLESLGIELVMKEKETGKEIKLRTPGAGRRCKQMVDKVIYDTETSNALSNNFYADGVNEYTDGKALELYIDREGRYFFVEYSDWEGVKDRITPVSGNDAAKFIAKYGTELHKTPSLV